MLIIIFFFRLQYSLIKKYGYPAENHTVTTDDGYVLTLHRIARPGATPVLLVHGLLDSSATWVMMGPNKGLGMQIAIIYYNLVLNLCILQATCFMSRDTMCGWLMCGATLIPENI